MIGGFVPSEVIISVNSAMLVAIVWLARQLSKANERISKLEGRLDARRDG